MPLYSKSQQQFLLDAINRVSPDAIMPADLSNCTFGIPKAIPRRSPEDPDTEITLRGRQGRGYIGTQTYRYNRLSLNDLFKNFVPQVTAPSAYGLLTTTAKKTAFAQNLNGRYGLNLVASDIPDLNVILNTENVFSAANTSVQYKGYTRFFSIRGKNNLEDLLLNDILDVLNHPSDPATHKRCATILSYGLDLTDEVQVMSGLINGSLSAGVNYSSGLSDALVAILVEKGFEPFDYTGAKVVQKTTVSEPRANTLYDKVLVITDVNDPHYAGDWLLHYNI